MTTSKLLSSFLKDSPLILYFVFFFFCTILPQQCTKMKHKSPRKKNLNPDKRVPFLFSDLLEPLRFRIHILTGCLVFTFDLDRSKKKRKRKKPDRYRNKPKNSVSFHFSGFIVDLRGKDVPVQTSWGGGGGKTGLGCTHKTELGTTNTCWTK